MRSFRGIAIACAIAALACSCAMVDIGYGYTSVTLTPRASFSDPPEEIRKPPAGPLELTVEKAILLALENNKAFRIQRLGPGARGTYEDELAAEFDPKLTAALDAAESTSIRSYGPIEPTKLESSSASGKVGLSKRLPLGTELGLEVSTGRSWTDRGGDLNNARVGLTVTQPILRGAGRRANLASIRQARLDTRSSEYELRGLAEALVADVESAYWDCALARDKIEIYEEHRAIAEKQLAETKVRIEIGVLAEAELAAAQAEVALRREALITARGTLRKAKLVLMRLTGAGLDRPEGDLILRERPTAPEVDLGEVGPHVKSALRKRPDLNQAKLALERGELEVVKTRNGLLPRLDLFVVLGKSGYADAFGDAVKALDDKAYDFSAGISLEYVFGNRSARARHERSMLSRDEADEALRNLEELIQLDVRKAHIDVEVRREQVTAVAATLKAREDAFDAETEKLRVGKSTTLLVAQAQRDVVASRISQIEAVVNLLRSLTEFHRAAGTLLEQKGLVAPGGGPPTRSATSTNTGPPRP